MKEKVTIPRTDPRVNQLLFGTAPGHGKDPALGLNWSATITYAPRTLRERCGMTDEQILELFPELAD